MKTLTQLALAALLLAPLPALAAPVAFSETLQDASGNRMAGATWTIGGVALTPGTPATVTGYAMATGAARPSQTVTEYDFGNGYYTFVYDPAGTDTYFPLVAAKSGSTFAAGGVVDLQCTVDPNNASAAATNTGTLITGQASLTAGQATLTNGQATITGQTNKIGTNSGDSPNEAAAQVLVSGISSVTSKFTFDSSSILYADAKTLPATAPAGYGGGSGGTASSVVFGDYPSGQAPASTYLIPAITHNASGQPVLAWTADSTATGYIVLRSIDNRATYQTQGTLPAGTLTYTDTTRPAGGTVYYHVVPTH